MKAIEDRLALRRRCLVRHNGNEVAPGNLVGRGVVLGEDQDVLGLGSEARMNQPGTTGGNWRWRLLPDQLTDAALAPLALLADTYDRSATGSSPDRPQ